MNREIRLPEIMTVLSITFLGIAAGIIVFNTALIGLVLGIFVAMVVCKKNGYTLLQLWQMIKIGAGSAKVILTIMSLIGMLSASWMLSGTIAAMMNLGFDYLTRMNALLAFFVITSIISLILGTSIGSISVIGIPFMEIGNTIGIPLPLIAGAIISGAYVGDRTSPISSSVNLTAAMTNTQVMDNIKIMLKTLWPVYLACMAFYFVLGREYTLLEDSIYHITTIQTMLDQHYTISWYTYLPPILLMGFALLRFPILYCILVGIFSSVVITLSTTDIGGIEILKTLIFGYTPENVSLNNIISGGGWLSMIDVILIILFSTALNGILEHTKMIEPLIDIFVKKIKTARELVLKTSVLCVIINAITCNQSLSIIIPGKFLKTEYQKKGLSKNHLSRTIADSGVVTVPLLPWNVNALAIVAILGVGTLSYTPYALLCYLLPIVTVAYGYLKPVNNQIRNNAHLT
ncbi:Na+/H+ antiporter NhaC family protein [Proteinivorax hydrogeniformans]|uniref:Na+/H+ antiporter NhaC family protein n=1 Tax=Proteinivorax hydrogeniformans TaxID=1826727 RepID=A0AAU8HU76_9FIRM